MAQYVQVLQIDQAALEEMIARKVQEELAKLKSNSVPDEMTTKEAAEYLGVVEGTIRNNAHRIGVLRRRGRRLIFSRTALDRWKLGYNALETFSGRRNDRKKNR